MAEKICLPTFTRHRTIRGSSNSALATLPVRGRSAAQQKTLPIARQGLALDRGSEPSPPYLSTCLAGNQQTGRRKFGFWQIGGSPPAAQSLQTKNPAKRLGEFSARLVSTTPDWARTSNLRLRRQAQESLLFSISPSDFLIISTSTQFANSLVLIQDFPKNCSSRNTILVLLDSENKRVSVNSRINNQYLD